MTTKRIPLTYNIWDQTIEAKISLEKNIQSLHLHIPEQCGKRHSSYCGSHPANCERVQQRLQPGEGWGDTHSDTFEGNCHGWKQIEPIRPWLKQVTLNMTVLCGSSLPITLWAWVPECLISAPDYDGTTPRHNYSHDTVDKRVDKLTRLKQLTQQGNLWTCNSWEDWREKEKKKTKIRQVY